MGRVKRRCGRHSALRRSHVRHEEQQPGRNGTQYRAADGSPAAAAGPEHQRRCQARSDPDPCVAAPQLERGGQVLQDQVAPKVSAALSSAAQHVDPGQPKPRQWRKVAAFSLLAAAGIVTALAGIRRRANAAAPAAEPAGSDTAPADTTPEDAAPGPEDAAPGSEDTAPGP